MSIENIVELARREERERSAQIVEAFIGSSGEHYQKCADEVRLGVKLPRGVRIPKVTQENFSGISKLHREVHLVS